MLRFIAIVGILFIIAWSCKKPVEYSTIPAISYQSFTKTVTTDLLGNKILRGQLSFYLIDGDGDIGLLESDTIYPYNPGSTYNYNLYLFFYKIENGNPVADTAFDLSYRTPYIEPQGQNKTRKCTILIDIDYEYDNSNHLAFDSIMYKFYMYDRSLNKSNQESTGTIVLE